jgi:hypothetical protein
VFFWPIILAIILLVTALFLWVLVSVLGGEEVRHAAVGDDVRVDHVRAGSR